MTATESETLWSDQSRTHFFLVPDDEPLPPGDFVVRALTGRQQTVAQIYITPFEVSSEEAQAWLGSQIQVVLGQAKTSILNWLGRLAPPTPPETPEAITSIKPLEPSPSESGVALWSALMGESEAALRSDPEAVKRGLRKLISDCDWLVEAAVSSDEEKLAEARARLQALRRTLHTHGVKVGEKIEELPQRLHALFRSAEFDQALRRSAKSLDEQADHIQKYLWRLEQALRQGAEKMRDLADQTAAGADEEQCQG